MSAELVVELWDWDRCISASFRPLTILTILCHLLSTYCRMCDSSGHFRLNLTTNSTLVSLVFLAKIVFFLLSIDKISSSTKEIDVRETDVALGPCYFLHNHLLRVWFIPEKIRHHCHNETHQQSSFGRASTTAWNIGKWTMTLIAAFCTCPAATFLPRKSLLIDLSINGTSD